jgi:orotate phosphoribosyltransferase-like protein
MATSAVTRLTRNSIEARELKAIELRNSGKTILQITNETNLSKGSVGSLLKRVKRNNNIWCPKKNAGHH